MDYSKKSEMSGRRSVVFRYRLWMLFMLFIPAAIYANRLGQYPDLIYTETRSEFWREGDQQIVFSRLPSGMAPLTGTNVNSEFQSLGVSFSYGLPDRLEKLKKSSAPLALAKLKTESGELIDITVSSTTPPINNTIRVVPPRNTPRTIFPGGATSKGSHIGISGYSFKFPEAQFSHSVCCFESVRLGRKRFRGPMTIRFHRPYSPDINAGVHRVGFYAARLNTPETLRVRLYTPDGRLIGSQLNITDRCVFMGFESKYLIGWLELEAIGADKDYAIGNLIIDNIEQHQ